MTVTVWSATVEYAVGDQVIFANQRYLSLRFRNYGFQPDTSPVWWQLQVLMQWNYMLKLWSTDAVGTIIGQPYYAGIMANGASGMAAGDVMAIPTRIGPPTYEKIEKPRELIDYSEAPLIVGYRPHLTVAWEQRSPGIVGVPGGTDLRTVLGSLTTAGNRLMVSLDYGATARWCNLTSDVNYKNVEGKNVALGLELTFSGRRLIASVPDLAPASWGTAT